MLIAPHYRVETKDYHLVDENVLIVMESKLFVKNVENHLVKGVFTRHGIVARWIEEAHRVLLTAFNQKHVPQQSEN